jgi:transcriptional regulator with XRE-family HTH domain
MALLSVIRRWHFREHLSVPEICGRTGLSRNTIRKYLRLNGVEPKFKVPERPSKLDPFADRLSVAEDGSQQIAQAEADVKQLHADKLAPIDTFTATLLTLSPNIYYDFPASILSDKLK